MSLKQLTALACALVALGFGSQAMAQANLTCDDIEFSSVVTNNYPSIADACDAVVERDGTLYARIQVAVQRVRGNNVTFRVLNNDGTSGGSYTQNVGPNWRANIAGRSYRARDLQRGQQLNVYLPSDRWAFVHETADEEPDTVAEIIPVAPAPMLPKTASQLPLAGLVGAGFLALGAALTLYRRRAGLQSISNR